MCGRFTQAFEDWSEVLAYFQVSGDGSWPARYNIAPTQDVPIIVSHGGERKIGPVSWGLVPRFAGAKRSLRPINARAETLLESRWFRPLLANRRCVIPVDSFYEWRQTDKQPLRIHLARRPVFALAGIYDTFTTADGCKVSSFAIITCQPNDFMAPIHNRMPVILDESALRVWLDAGLRDAEAAASVLTPTDEEMTAYPVHPRVGNVRHDDPELIRRFDS
ncbi:MAG: SOS response-associated peptidase [Alicyclobacillus herbarius]|uniref:SOS response-associated peptidase n=1 Tax=Alicyclobacillus herbarius TaxID=122960 RepID=UPI00042A2220|nr:SOS response-associated peptidase [Alicyclobacillus herbarius]MCL6633097.1 SOS response-associated peptidase [Alicyclobacillus herbarius]